MNYLDIKLLYMHYYCYFIINTELLFIISIVGCYFNK